MLTCWACGSCIVILLKMLEPSICGLVQYSRAYHGTRESLWAFMEGHLGAVGAAQKNRKMEDSDL